MSLKLNTASGGSISLQETNTASNLTLTLPAVDGTVITDKYAGTVLQVVSATSTTQYTTSSSTYQATNLTATITPKSSSNKILVFVQTQLGVSINNWTDIGIHRNGTPLFGATANSGTYTNTSTDSHTPGVIIQLDSPASTSATTYTMYFRGRQSAQARVIIDSMLSTITLMEIAA